MFGSLSPLGAIVGVLSVWRVTHLLWGEDGPGDIFVRLRKAVGGGFFGRLLDCFYCLSLWAAIPFAVLLVEPWIERVVLWLGLSGGAIVLERITVPKGTPLPAPSAIWHEEPMPPVQDKTFTSGRN